MADPVDIGAARWQRNGAASDHAPIDALRAGIRAIEAGDIDPDHIIVIYGKTMIADEGTLATATGYFQAGSFDPYQQAGLINRANFMMQKTGDMTP